MCIFSGPVDTVCKTRIFSRIDGDTQHLVYQMEYDTKNPVAMILPIPVKLGSGEKAVKFEDLSEYEDFFKDMHEPFIVRTRGFSKGLGGALDACFSLEVHNVGSFEASFSPTLNDMDRLDPRFKLDRKIWDKLPQYKDYGFVVFKLKPDNKKTHPMAFSFPTRMNDTFYPTIHIHDGELEAHGDYDHDLYAQLSGVSDGDQDWRGANQAKHYMKIDKTKGLVSPHLNLLHRRIVGRQANRDILLSAK